MTIERWSADADSLGFTGLQEILQRSANVATARAGQHDVPRDLAVVDERHLGISGQRTAVHDEDTLAAKSAGERSALGPGSPQPPNQRLSLVGRRVGIGDDGNRGRATAAEIGQRRGAPPRLDRAGAARRQVQQAARRLGGQPRVARRGERPHVVAGLTRTVDAVLTTAASAGPTWTKSRDARRWRCTL